MRINKKTVVGIVAGTVVASSLGFGSYASAMNKDVTLSVDGEPLAVTVWGSSVQDVLDANDIDLTDKDEVSPAAGDQVSDGDTITVRYARQLTVIADGDKQTCWTTATTLDDALAEIGLHDPDLRLSVDRSMPLGREGLTVTATTPKDVQITVDGQTISGRSAAATVADLLAEQGITVSADDRITPGADALVTAGLSVTVQRVETSEETVSERIDYQTVSTEDSNLAKGTTQEVTAGEEGEKSVVYKIVKVDGQEESRTVISESVVSEPVTREVKVGTKVTTSSGNTGAAAPVMVALRLSASR